jgi:hypothetical protein
VLFTQLIVLFVRVLVIESYQDLISAFNVDRVSLLNTLDAALSNIQNWSAFTNEDLVVAVNNLD